MNLTTGSRLTPADIGAWLFTCNPGEFREFGDAVDGFCAHSSYRVGLVTAGQPALLWVSGAAGSDPAPGIWMVGRTTGPVRRDRPRPRVGLALTRLPAPVTRERLRADPRTARLEVLRAPQMSNPSVVTPAELAAIAEFVGDWP